MAAAAGHGCRPAQLTSVAYSPSGLPLAAGACASAGQADIVRLAGGHWSRIGPVLPAALARRDVEVLQMARAGRTVAALLAVGRGPAARLLGAWSNPDGTSWNLSQPYQAGAARPLSAAFGSSGAGTGSPSTWLAGCPAVGRPGRVRQRAWCGLAVPARAARGGVAAARRRGYPGGGSGRIRGPDGPGQPAVGLGPILEWFRMGPVAGHQRGHSLWLVLVR